jgi:hypothetical protein
LLYLSLQYRKVEPLSKEGILNFIFIWVLALQLGV